MKRKNPRVMNNPSRDVIHMLTQIQQTKRQKNKTKCSNVSTRTLKNQPPATTVLKNPSTPLATRLEHKTAKNHPTTSLNAIN